jgi:hypothetical protein
MATPSFSASLAMPDEFDPYHKWLGIAPPERPADFYRLLGVPRFEANADVISNAADARMAFIRTFQAGSRAAFATQILNELATARTTLLGDRRTAYDSELRSKVASQEQSAAVIPVAEPQEDPQQLAARLELQRQLESVRARETELAQQQAQYAAALAQAEAQRHRSSPAPQIIRATDRRERRQQSSIPLPLVIGGVTAAIVALVAVGVLAMQWGRNQPIAQPTPPPVTPVEDAAKPTNTTPPTPVVETKVIDKKGSDTTSIEKVAANKTDLLALIETPQHVRMGQATKSNGTLSILASNGFAMVEVPLKLPDDFQLDLEITPRNAPDSVILGLAIGGRPCMVSIDGYRMNGSGPRTALEMIDGARPQERRYPATPFAGQVLQSDTKAKVTVRVLGNSLQLICNGRQLFAWSGDPKRVAIHPLFGEHEDRSLFIGTWQSHYDISSFTFEPLDKMARPLEVAAAVPSIEPATSPPSKPTVTRPTRTPAPARTPTFKPVPWRWARHRGDARDLALSPGGDVAILSPANLETALPCLINLADGRRMALNTPTGLEGADSLAVDNAPNHLLAGTRYSEGKRSLWMFPLTPDQDQETPSLTADVRQPEIRLGFSGTGLLAHSSGKGIAVVTVRNCAAFAIQGTIETPKQLNGAFVERIYEDQGSLAIVYSGKIRDDAPKMKGPKEKKKPDSPFKSVLLVSYHDWQSRARKTLFLLPSGNGYEWSGFTLVGKRLRAWGRTPNDSRTLYTFSEGNPDGERTLSYGGIVGVTRRIADARPQDGLVLMIDVESPRLIVEEDRFGKKSAEVQFSQPLKDARIVLQGAGILCLSDSPLEPLLLYDTKQLLRAGKQNKAPTCAELSLTNGDAEQSIQPPESTPSGSVPPAEAAADSTNLPNRDLARAELGKFAAAMPGGQVNFLMIKSSQFGEDDAELLLAFPELTGLNFENVQPTTKMLQHLARLPKLSSLAFNNCPVTDEHLAALAQAPALQSLALQRTEVAGPGLAQLAALPLKSIVVLPPPNLEGWQAIGKMKGLQHITAMDQNFGDDQLAAIAGLPNLKMLNITASKVTGKGLQQIGSLSGLEYLNLPQDNVDDEGLRSLPELRLLKQLILPSSATDKAVEFLPVAALERLHLSPLMTDAALKAVVAKCPDLQGLGLTNCGRLTVDGFQELARHQKLRQIDLPPQTDKAMCEQLAKIKSLTMLNQFAGQNLGAAELACFRGHPALQDVRLQGGDDGSLAELVQAPQLRSVSLFAGHCTAKGLQALTKAGNLQQLSLRFDNETHLDPASLAALASLKQLKTLSLSRVEVEQSALNDLKQSLPKTQVQVSKQ